jgi:L-arabinose isomerase
MDMQAYVLRPELSPGEAKLRRHCEAIRRNKDVLIAVFEFLSTNNASAAQESFEELSQEDQIAIWSVSTTSGGIWFPHEREMLKTGQLGPAWDVYAARHNRLQKGDSQS